jgi:hypothetical protein
LPEKSLGSLFRAPGAPVARNLVSVGDFPAVMAQPDTLCYISAALKFEAELFGAQCVGAR